MLKRIISLLFSAAFLISGTGLSPVSAENAAAAEAFCYENTFDLGIDSAVDFEDENLSLTVPAKNLMKTAQLDGNNGITYINPNAWAVQPGIRADFKNEISSGVLTVSFDFKPADASILKSHTGDNHSFGMKMQQNWDGRRIAYFRADDGKRIKYIPMTQVGDWEDGDSAVYMDGGLHTIVWTFDYDNGKLLHYLDGTLVKTQTNLAAFPIEDFEIALGGQFSYFDNLRISYMPSGASVIKTIYQNSFDNGAADRKSTSDENGSISYSGNVHSLMYQGNAGWGMNESAWANSETVKYTLKNPADSGRVRISFDTMRMSIDDPQPAYIKLGGRYVFYMTDRGFYGPNQALWGWGDTSAMTPFEKNVLYHIELVYDFDVQKAYTYVNNELLSERSMPKDFKLENIDMQLSMINEYFDELKIEREYQQPVECRLSSDNLGNIFFEDETVEITLEEQNVATTLIDDNPKITVKNAAGETVFSENILIKTNSGERKERKICVSGLDFGVYTAEVESEYGAKASMQLSKSVESPMLNQRLGTCTHMLRYPIDIPKNMELLAKAGFSGLRIDFIWADSTSSLASFDKVVDEAAKYGIDVLALLPISDGTKDSDGGFNTDEDFLSRYADYCTLVANYFKGRVTHYELGNEVNYMKKFDGTPDLGADYAKILRAGYNALKAVDKNNLVSTAGTAIVYTDTDRNQRQVATGMLGEMQENGFCFDIFATHPYHVAQPPEVKDMWIEHNSWPEQAMLAKQLLNQYGAQNKLSWATEVGWASYGINETRGSYHVRMLALNDTNHYNDRTFFYDNVDHGYDTSDVEDCYGMIRNWNNEFWYSNTAYSAKPTFLAAAQWNKMTADKEGTELIADGSKYIAWFENESEKTAVVWTTDASADITVQNGCTGLITVRDMYGNVTAETSGSGITVAASGKPMYVTFSGDRMTAEHNGIEINTLGNVKDGDEIVFKAHSLKPNGKFIIAAYAGDALVNAYIKDLDSDGNAEKALVQAGADRYKMMLWDDFSSMKSITPSRVLQNRGKYDKIKLGMDRKEKS